MPIQKSVKIDFAPELLYHVIEEKIYEKDNQTVVYVNIIESEFENVNDALDYIKNRNYILLI